MVITFETVMIACVIWLSIFFCLITAYGALQMNERMSEGRATVVALIPGGPFAYGFYRLVVLMFGGRS